MNRKYIVRFAFCAETIYAENKQDAKARYIEKLQSELQRLGLKASEEDLKCITVKCTT